MPSAHHAELLALTDDGSSTVLKQKAPDPQLALTDADHRLHWSKASLCQLQVQPSATSKFREKKEICKKI